MLGDLWATSHWMIGQYCNQIAIIQKVLGARARSHGVAPVRVKTSEVQIILGRGFTSEFSDQRFQLPANFPTERLTTQTRSHILADCPDHEEHRDILTSASQDLSPHHPPRSLQGQTLCPGTLHRASNAFRIPEGLIPPWARIFVPFLYSAALSPSSPTCAAMCLSHTMRGINEFFLFKKNRNHETGHRCIKQKIFVSMSQQRSSSSSNFPSSWKA